MQNEHIDYFFKSGFYTTFQGEKLETHQGALHMELGAQGIDCLLEAAFDRKSWLFLKQIPALQEAMGLAEKQNHKVLVFRLVDPPQVEQSADLSTWIDAGILDLNRYVLQRSQASIKKSELSSLTSS